jgi:hypothetical protein
MSSQPDPTSGPMLDQYEAMVTNIEQMHQLEDGTSNFTYPWALQNDVLHYGDMLQSEDRPKFVAAMESEMNGLKEMLEVVPRSSLLPTPRSFLLSGHLNVKDYPTGQF